MFHRLRGNSWSHTIAKHHVRMIPVHQYSHNTPGLQTIQIIRQFTIREIIIINTIFEFPEKKFISLSYLTIIDDISKKKINNKDKEWSI